MTSKKISPAKARKKIAIPFAKLPDLLRSAGISIPDDLVVMRAHQEEIGADGKPKLAIICYSKEFKENEGAHPEPLDIDLP